MPCVCGEEECENGQPEIDGMYGESPGESAMREVRMATLATHAYDRKLWEEAFWKYVNEKFFPWQQKILLAFRYRRISGDWPMTDLPDGSEC